MQGPKFFENQFIRTDNLDFFKDSNNKNLTNFISSLTKNRPGIIGGFSITQKNYTTVTVSAGSGYDGNGNYVVNYSGLDANPSEGLNILYAAHADSEINPEDGDYIENTDAITGNKIKTTNYDSCVIISLASGTNIVSPYIPIGLINVSGGVIQSIDTSSNYRYDLMLGNGININNFSIDGAYITSGTISTNRIKNPWDHDIVLDSGISILDSHSGTSTIGSQTYPFKTINTNLLNTNRLSGTSSILVDQDFIFSSGSSIESSGQILNIDTLSNGSKFGGQVEINNIQSNNNITIQGNDLQLTSLDNLFIQSNTSNISSVSDILIETNTNLNIISNKTNLESSLSVSGVSTFGSDINYSGTLNKLEMLTTEQSFNNLVLSPEFNSLQVSGLSYNTSTSLSWMTIGLPWMSGVGTMGAMVPKFISEDSEQSLLNVDCSAKTYAYATITGYTSILSGLIAKQYVYGTTNNKYYNASIFMKQNSGSSIIRLEIRNDLTGWSYYKDFNITTSWQRYNFTFLLNANPSFDGKLTINVYGLSASTSYMSFTGIQLTKGKSLIPYIDNKQSLYSYISTTSNQQLGGYIYSKGQFAQFNAHVDMAYNPTISTASWETVCNWLKLYINGSVERYSQNYHQLWAENESSLYGSTLNINYVKYLPAGLHLIYSEYGKTTAKNNGIMQSPHTLQILLQ